MRKSQFNPMHSVLEGVWSTFATSAKRFATETLRTFKAKASTLTGGYIDR